MTHDIPEAFSKVLDNHKEGARLRMGGSEETMKEDSQTDIKCGIRRVKLSQCPWIG